MDIDQRICMTGQHSPPRLSRTSIECAGKPKKSMKRMMSMGGAGQTGPFSAWQATIDDLAKAPAARLMPFVKVPSQLSQTGLKIQFCKSCCCWPGPRC